jgi:hypothetical protein
VKINKENIESFIFDYHEGNLSDSDKAEVLNFIHLHPEYENDFAQWAQSYFHAEDPIKNYGIADTLLQKKLINWYSSKWILSSGGVALLAIGLYSYLFLVKPETQTKDKILSPVTSEIQTERVEKAIPSIIDMDQRPDENPEATATHYRKNSITPTSVSTAVANSTLDTLVDDTHIDAPINNPVKNEGIATVDTVQKNIPTQENSLVKSKKIPAKQKSRLRLKAENKFIPTNPDF